MEEENTLISGIEYKLRTLLKKLEKLKEDKLELEEQKIRLKEIAENQKNRIDILEEKLKTLKKL